MKNSCNIVFTCFTRISRTLEILFVNLFIADGDQDSAWDYSKNKYSYLFKSLPACLTISAFCILG